MTIKTLVYANNQTTIPAKLRKKYNIEPEDIIEWNDLENGRIEINFRKKVSIKEMIESINFDEETNSVELVRDIYK